MAVKINFDSTHNVEMPTLVLAKRSGDKLGTIPAANIVYKETLTSGSELSFRVYKYDNGNENKIWSDITDFKLLYCPEWNHWFEISVELDESNDTVKNVQAQSLGIAELSQIMLYGIEINTDTDIESESFSNYGKTILYSDNAEISMLNRLIKDKASHYQIGHIDDTLITETENRLVQFTFSGKSLYDALQEIAEELNALLYIDTSTVQNSTDRLGEISRTINMYDLESNCKNCGHRGDFKGTCPKCGAGAEYIAEGYGEDTTIFVSVDNLSDDINFTTDNDSVKNCFKLEAGDETMTDIIRSCNANGSNYIWYISDRLKEDMSPELVQALEDYDKLYEEYQNTHQYSFSVANYQELVNKYKAINQNLQDISATIQGYPALMTAYYNTLDFYMYLYHQLMPSVETESTTAESELNKAKTYLTQKGVALRNYTKYTSDSTIESQVKNIVGVLVSNNYQVSVSTQATTFNESKTTGTWKGSITLSRYYESELDPPASVSDFTINLNSNDEQYYKQLIDKKISQTASDQTYGASALLSLDMSDTDLQKQLGYYGLQSLKEFQTICEAILNILIEQGVADRDQWNQITGTENLYKKMYLPYCSKADLIERALTARENELQIIQDLQSTMDAERQATTSALNFENYLRSRGQNIWVEFCSFRREDTYSNSNYISDGLDNAELFNQALKFIDIAKKEIYRSATLQHSISSSLHNLLVIKEFEPLVKHFKVGNWIHIRVDEEYYKLRLVDYEIDFDDLDDISVTFSDVTTTADGYSDIENVISSAKSISSTYSSVQRQADKGNQSNQQIKHWVEDGLALTNLKLKSDAVDQTQSWDENGMLFRRIIPETGEYDDVQMKIINTTLAITDDNWESVKAAVGKFRYRDMFNNGAWKDGYGINGELIVGKMFLGESLGIFSVTDTGTTSMSFNHNGLSITNSTTDSPKNTITINPNSNSVFTIRRDSDNANLIYFNADGSGRIGGWNIGQYDLSSQFSTPTIISEEVTQTRDVPAVDENGDPIYELVTVTDDQGNPVYETDENGNTIYTDSDIQATDSQGNLIWETDDDGNDVVDVDGNKIPVYVQIPVVKTEYQRVYTTETYTTVIEREGTEYYDNYTTLKTQGDIALSIGATSRENLETGKIKLFNTGVAQSIRSILYNGGSEPQIVYKRDKENGLYTQAKIYLTQADNAGIAFAFKDKNATEYVYSTFINRSGIYPYVSGFNLGSSGFRWGSLYVGTINATGNIRMGNTLNMVDTRNKVQSVIRLYPFSSGTDYGNSNLVIQACGSTFIGSGESPINLYNAFKSKYGNEEYMYVSSDSDVYFYSNCQTVSNRKGLVFTKGGHLYSMKDNTSYLGTSSYRWKGVYAKSGAVSTSDEKVKTNIQPIQNNKEFVMALKAIQYNFTYADSDRLHYGFTSQGVKQALDTAGIEDCGVFCLDVSDRGAELGFDRDNAPEKYLIYGLRYEELIAPAIAVIQEHEQTISELQSELAEVKQLLER